MFLKMENANGKNEKCVEQPETITEDFYRHSCWDSYFRSRQQHLQLKYVATVTETFDRCRW
jgi:hypothetical protein